MDVLHRTLYFGYTLWCVLWMGFVEQEYTLHPLFMKYIALLVVDMDEHDVEKGFATEDRGLEETDEKTDLRPKDEEKLLLLHHQDGNKVHYGTTIRAVRIYPTSLLNLSL